MSLADPWIYVVLLGVAALIYAILLPPRKTAVSTNQDGLGDIEATLEQYMAEIERDNDELIQLVTQMKQDFSSKQLAQQEQIVELRKRVIDIEKLQTRAELTVPLSEVNKTDIPPAYNHSSVDQNEESAAINFGEPSTMDVIEQQEDAVVELEMKSMESVRDRYPQVFDLYEQGKSIDMIAKATGIHKGEIQLILQLAKREEA